MARPNIGSLKEKRKFSEVRRAGNKVSSFTYDDAVLEDRKRVRLLRGTYKELSKPERKQAKHLVEALTYDRELPATLASSAYYEVMRHPVLDQLVKLTWRLQPCDLRVATLLPRESHRSNLEGFKARVFCNALRVALDRAGGRKAEGWVFASVHGEWRSDQQVFVPHYHLIVAGQQMIAAVKRLKGQRGYTRPSAPPPAGRKKWPPPVRLSKVRKGELRYTLSYCLQSWWPERWDGADEMAARAATRRRIAGAKHTEFLTWLDRQDFNDMYLLYGLRVGRNGLQVSPKRVRQ